MQDILFNLALLDTTNYCKSNGIDCSGTHLVKYPRKFIYALCNENGAALVTVTFSKNSVPNHFIHNIAKEQRNTKIERLRSNMPGYILGDLTPFATDSDVLEICEINDRKAAIHNHALNGKKYAK